MLDPSIDFLNHGCFGARLREVVAAQQAWREEFEARPVSVLDRHRDRLLREIKRAIGAFLGMAPESFGLVTNATDGVNAILGSRRFAPGDEVASTSHVYNAVRKTMERLAERDGFSPRFIHVPLPVRDPEEITGAVMRGLTDRTRLLIIDHVTSPTAVIFPVEAIVKRCAERGIDVLVDGAHAPGMLPLDVESIGAAYYVGNLHKWVGAPTGAAFLWARPDRKAGVHPTVVSHFLGEGLAAEFSWQGTRDVSAWVAAPVAIAAMARLAGPGGWDAIRAHNRALAAWTHRLLCDAWSVDPLTPLDGAMIGSIVAVTLPAGVRGRFETPVALHDSLYDDHGFEVPIIEWEGRWLIRPSCQVYNRAEQYRRLAAVVGAMR
jgi:isopenicillin-N epimerase